VSPKKTTTYDLTATGPGGVVKASTTVASSKSNRSCQIRSVALRSALSTDRRQGAHARERDAELSASNVDAVSLGSVWIGGSRRNALSAAHSDSKHGWPSRFRPSATVCMRPTCVGVQRPRQLLSISTGSSSRFQRSWLNSVFFPSDYPEKKRPTVGNIA